MLFQTYNPNNPSHQLAASQIEDWSRQAGSAMLPLDAERTAKFRRRILAVDGVTQELLGHVGVEFSGKRESMLSGLVISPEHRARGIATMLLRQSVAEVSALTGNLDSFTSYVNANALHAYKNIGARVIGVRTGEILTDCINIVDLLPVVTGYRNDTNDVLAQGIPEPAVPKLSIVAYSPKSIDAA